MEYRKQRAEHAPIDGAEVEWVECFKFLGVRINKDLSWSKHTNTVVKKARQQLFPLRRLKGFAMGSQILESFCSIESILTGCITAWYGNCLACDCKALQKVGRTTQYINGAELSAIQDLYTRRCQKGPNNCQTPATQVIDCSLCYRTASGTDAPTLEPTGP